MARSGSNSIGTLPSNSLSARHIADLTASLLNKSAGSKGCINTNSLIDTGSLQLAGIQSVTGSATLSNSTTILVVSNDAVATITMTADTGGEVIGRILLIKNLNENYGVVLGGTTCAASYSVLCYYTGSAWTNLITLAY